MGTAAEIISRKMQISDIDDVINFVKEFDEDFFVDELHDENIFYIIGEFDGEIFSCANFKIFLNDAEVAIFTVAPKFRGRGLAQKLLAALMENAKSFQFKTMTFDIAGGNIPALHILKKAGFTIVERSNCFCDGENAVTLRADLEEI